MSLLRSRALAAMRTVVERGSGLCCPAHSSGAAVCGHASSAEDTDYAFEIAVSTVRYGHGVTREVGQDVANLGAKKTLVFTDKTLLDLPPFAKVAESLSAAKIQFDVYSDVRVEPTEQSFKDAIETTGRSQYDAFVAVGGGSVIDTAKAANLYVTNPNADFFDYIRVPFGKGMPITHQLKPLIAVPTTSGTGSETTGVAVFNCEKMQIKTGISHRLLKPTLGIIDPEHTATMPNRVAAYSGFDALTHALESFTALPYNQRKPRPTNPNQRTMYQGANPVSDVWCRWALRASARYLRRSVRDQGDSEARDQIHLAASMAGVGFGNAGVHLPHCLSYPISNMVRDYRTPDYPSEAPLVPHGLAVVITAPSVFEFTAAANPERHLEAAELLGADVTGVKREDAGRLLRDTLRQYMQDLEVPDGLRALGFDSSDVEPMVKGVMPQQNLRNIAPQTQTHEDIALIYENSMRTY